jgi:O-antigen/teichoic acid export membrane protein
MTSDPPIDPERTDASAIASPALDPAVSPPSTLRRDIISGYVLTISRIAAWAGVSAIVYRVIGMEAFAILALLRGTITLISYTSLGIGPAMVRMLAEALASVPTAGPRRDVPEIAANAAVFTSQIAYRSVPVPEDWTPVARVYACGRSLARRLAGIAAIATFTYAIFLDHIHRIPSAITSEAVGVVFGFGFGVAWRIASEVDSAALQLRRRLALDNSITAAGELLWLALVVASYEFLELPVVAFWWYAISMGQSIARHLAVRRAARELVEHEQAYSGPVTRRLLNFGLALTVAQLADFLYAPTDYILINRLLSPEDVATYAPLVQIDAALLLLVSGLALALFPHASLAHAAGDRARLKSLYLKATAASAAMLFAAGCLVWILSPIIFRVWLGSDLPAARALLPLVLIHTIVGGSSAVGRSILLGMGRVKAFTASVLIAGAANVILSAIFALIFGLKGIVLGTIVVVVARCAIWMPWYVLRSLRTGTGKMTPNAPALSPSTGTPGEGWGGGSDESRRQQEPPP